MDYTQKVLKLLVKKFDWNLNTSLTNTGKKLVSDTIKALDIIKENESKLHQPTVISSVCKHEWYETENFYIKCKKCNQLKNFMQTDL